MERVSETHMLRLQNLGLRVELAQKELDRAHREKSEYEHRIIEEYKLSAQDRVKDDGSIVRLQIVDGPAAAPEGPHAPAPVRKKKR
jgi:hypothetical protein